MFIDEILAREILDSRGNPTVEAEVVLEDGTVGRASVPSGASTGEAEAVELRDGDKRAYLGKGVRKAVSHVNNTLAGRLEGADPLDQRGIDLEMLLVDGTPNKAKLGANALLAVSEAVARAGAALLQLPLYRYLGGVHAHRLPVPMLNVINGGAHADNSIDIQEFMVVPAGAPSFREALRAGAEVYHRLKALLKERKLGTGVGDEGGFAPNLPADEEALKLLVEAVERAGYKPGRDVFLALDVAASNAWDPKSRKYRIGGPQSSAQLVALYEKWLGRYPILSIEDGVGEHDAKGWKALTDKIGPRVQLVADDYVVTNPALIRKAVQDEIANAVLIKPNQIGTVSETMEAVELTKRAGYGVVVSHRSGETEDSFIADLAVAVNADFIKTGAPCRMDRLAKYNQLLRIEEDLGDAARYAGPEVLERLRT
jgi:enolase